MQPLSEGISLQVSNIFQSLDTPESSWIEMCYTRPWYKTKSLLWGINPHLYLSESCTYLAQRTQFMCWLSENRNFCLWTVHTLTVLSSEAVTKDWPSLEKLTLLTVAVWALNTVDSPLLYRRKEHFKTAQQSSKDIMYLKTQSFCMLSSAINHHFYGNSMCLH